MRMYTIAHAQISCRRHINYIFQSYNGFFVDHRTQYLKNSIFCDESDLNWMLCRKHRKIINNTSQIIALHRCTTKSIAHQNDFFANK